METKDFNHLKKLALDELRKEYGLADDNQSVTRGSCTLSMKCAYHTVSCTSATGDCETVKKDLVVNNQVVDNVTVEIICDGKSYKC